MRLIEKFLAWTLTYLSTSMLLTVFLVAAWEQLELESNAAFTCLSVACVIVGCALANIVTRGMNDN